jgi:hypothetical protein
VTFDAILKKCGKVVALDGDFGNKSYDYLKTVNREQDFVVSGMPMCPPYETGHCGH